MSDDVSAVKNQFAVTRVFDVSVDNAWLAWSSSEQVMRWWGPAGFMSPTAAIDLREGGVSVVCLRAPEQYGGRETYSTLRYTKIEPRKRMEFVLSLADRDGNKLTPTMLGLPAGIPVDLPYAIEFKEYASQQTVVTVTAFGYASQLAIAVSRVALEQSLDKMAAILQVREPQLQLLGVT